MIQAAAHRLDVRDLLRYPSKLRHLVESWHLERFDKLILIGCAPCQGFAAHRKAIQGKDLRRHLFVVFARLVAKLHPDAVFVENVPDIFSERNWPYFAEAKRIMEEAGYLVRSRIYNFADFGLPQERFRAVVLAHPFRFPMPHPPLDHTSHTTVRQVIGYLPALSAGERSQIDPMHFTSRHRSETVATLAQVPPDGGNRPPGVGPRCLDRARKAYGGYTDVYGRLAWDKPAVTMTARCRTPSCGRFAHPEQNRGLSVREAALLQGFPEDYYFEGPFDDKFKQIGNAVPPAVAKAFAEHMLRILNERTRLRHFADLALDVTKPVGPGFAITINGIKLRRNRALRAR